MNCTGHPSVHVYSYDASVFCCDSIVEMSALLWASQSLLSKIMAASF